MQRLLLFLSLFLTTLTSLAQDRIILDFEVPNAKGLPQGWYTGIGGGGGTSGQSPAKWAMDSVVKQNGRYSLSAEFESKDDFISAVHTIKKTYDGHEITLTGYLKTENVKGSAGLWMRIDDKNGKVLQFDNMMSRPVSGTTDWKEYSITLMYDRSAARTINVGGLLIGSGRLWLDNFRLQIDDQDISLVKEYAQPNRPADNDTAFTNGSGIASIDLTAEKTETLAKLGRLWGFLKYYHADVREGKHNMDAALFRVLPQVLEAQNSAAADAVLERWVDGFGKPTACPSCKKLEGLKNVTLKPDFGPLFKDDYLPSSLTDKLKFIRDNRSSKAVAHYYIDLVPQVQNPQFLNEEAYSKQACPDAGVRLLALYRYWNMIQYFFPYRHLIGEDWNAVLPSAIPEFVSAKDTMAYQLAALKLIARIHDTHAGLWQGGTKLPEAKGTLITPFHARFVEDKLVVMGYYKDTLGVGDAVTRGDVIQSIDGVAVEDLVKKFLPLTPASNYETQLRDMPSYTGFLLRSNTPEAKLRILHDGKEREVTIQRIPVSWDMWGKEEGRKRSDVGYKKLDDNIGYLYPAKLTEKSLDSVKAMLHDTKGLVIDLRCYPTTFMPFTYGAWLKPKASPFVKFTNGSLDWPGAFIMTRSHENGGKNSDAYKGKVVILVNETSQSNAEYTTMALQTIPGAVTIGSTTAGADGNVSEITLPGGLGTMISGINVLYPDGTETQRAGVKIDRVVKPTIAGVREGKDEVLEEALRMINKDN